MENITKALYFDYAQQLRLEFRRQLTAYIVAYLSLFATVAWAFTHYRNNLPVAFYGILLSFILFIFVWTGIGIYCNNRGISLLYNRAVAEMRSSLASGIEKSEKEPLTYLLPQGIELRTRYSANKWKFNLLPGIARGEHLVIDLITGFSFLLAIPPIFTFWRTIVYSSNFDVNRDFLWLLVCIISIFYFPLIGFKVAFSSKLSLVRAESINNSIWWPIYAWRLKTLLPVYFTKDKQEKLFGLDSRNKDASEIKCTGKCSEDRLNIRMADLFWIAVSVSLSILFATKGDKIIPSICVFPLFLLSAACFVLFFFLFYWKIAGRFKIHSILQKANGIIGYILSKKDEKILINNGLQEKIANCVLIQKVCESFKISVEQLSDNKKKKLINWLRGKSYLNMLTCAKIQFENLIEMSAQKNFEGIKKSFDAKNILDEEHQKKLFESPLGCLPS